MAFTVPQPTNSFFERGIITNYTKFSRTSFVCFFALKVFSPSSSPGTERLETDHQWFLKKINSSYIDFPTINLTLHLPTLQETLA